MDFLLNKSKGMIIVSHDLASIERLCSRAIWLDHGTIKMDGKPEDVVKAYRTSC
jgi:ABC-type polysaccharide/polyol phosphate transport system ATPase subunit